MIHVIGKDNSDHYSDIMQEMWRQRHDVFVKKLGWNLNTNGSQEIDAYDTSQAVYLVRLDDDGMLKGSIRMLPTVGEHLMRDHFAHLCAEGVPAGPTIWEGSRLYSLTARHNRLDSDRTIGEIITGMMEYALECGIEKITCVASITLFPTLLKAGWDIEPLGLPVIAENDLILAFCITVNAEGLEKVRAKCGITESLLVHPTMPHMPPLKAAGSKGG